MEIPYPYSVFPKNPYPYPSTHHNLTLNFFRTRTRTQFSKVICTRLIYAPQNQNFPDLRTFYVSVPRYDCLNVDALPLRTSDSGRTHSHIIASTARRRTQKIKENIEINYQAIGIGKTFFFNKLDLSSYNYKKKYPSKNGLQLAQSLIFFEIN